ncbi:MAG TPA: hypothetical protein VHL78_01655, partial [Actinomycetota bacterium]|nr:hypothetical protein [Actinomycetota bacterium]
VTLTATPATGWAFDGWGGACEGTGSCVVTMSEDREVTATFTEVPTPTHTLSVSVDGQGTVASTDGGIDCGEDCTEDYDEGTEVTLTATPATGWAFDGWGGACEGTGSCVVTMNDDLVVTATFSELPPNRAPVLTVPKNQTVDEGQGVDLPISATDADSDTLVLEVTSELSKGTLTNPAPWSQGPDGTWHATYHYQSNPCQPGGGPDRITFTISDGRGGTDSEEIQITVNCGRGGGPGGPSREVPSGTSVQSTQSASEPAPEPQAAPPPEPAEEPTEEPAPEPQSEPEPEPEPEPTPTPTPEEAAPPPENEAAAPPEETASG